MPILHIYLGRGGRRLLFRDEEITSIRKNDGFGATLTTQSGCEYQLQSGTPDAILPANERGPQHEGYHFFHWTPPNAET
jgi:hypothetical protein